MTNEEYYAMLDRNHLCHRCHREKAFQGRKFCPECLEKMAASDAKQYVRMTAEDRKKDADKRREIYHQHKDEGICIRCNRPATYGLYCYEHYIRMKRMSRLAAQKRRRESADRVNVREWRIEHRLCFNCGAPIEDGNPTKVCNACRARLAQNLAKSPWRQQEFKFGRELHEQTYESGQAGTRAGGV